MNPSCDVIDTVCLWRLWTSLTCSGSTIRHSIIMVLIQDLIYIGCDILKWPQYNLYSKGFNLSFICKSTYIIFIKFLWNTCTLSANDFVLIKRQWYRWHVLAIYSLYWINANIYGWLVHPYRTINNTWPTISNQLCIDVLCLLIHAFITVLPIYLFIYLFWLDILIPLFTDL